MSQDLIAMANRVVADEGIYGAIKAHKQRNVAAIFALIVCAIVPMILLATTGIYFADEISVMIADLPALVFITVLAAPVISLMLITAIAVHWIADKVQFLSLRRLAHDLSLPTRSRDLMSMTGKTPSEFAALFADDETVRIFTDARLSWRKGEVYKCLAERLGAPS